MGSAVSLQFSATVAERDFAVELTIPDGQIISVTGPNGSGKSTLLALIAGLLRPDSGSLILDGRVLFDERTWVPAHRRGIVLMSQRVLLFPHLNVRDNVAFGPRATGLSRAEARERAVRWLEEVGAPELADRRATELSGGQAQRVALARGLAAEPRLLLLDEPLAALDIAAAPQMRALLGRELAGRTAVLVSHDPEDVRELAVRNVRLRSGRVESDTAAG